MAPLSSAAMRRKAKEAKIFFADGVYNAAAETPQVPEEHHHRFRDIQKLGRTIFDTYNWTPGLDDGQKPWIFHRKALANRVREVAVQKRKERQNEDGWRDAIEHLVLERFEVEVVCKRCRKRLWRSEVEASLKKGSPGADSLTARQAKREPCTCTGRAEDCLDSGLCGMFTTRISTRSLPAIDLDDDKGKTTKKPDRIVGLRRTKKFDELLERPYGHGDTMSPATVERTVATCMNPQNGGQELLFPFLVLEAKSQNGDSFWDLEAQSAFPIRNALKLQYDMLKTGGNDLDTLGGPLVWFLANRGEHWHVYGALIEEKNNVPYHWIYQLWSGEINNWDGSLQLLLILDYILDWARDVYRPNILHQLNQLGTHDARDVRSVIDSEVLSVHAAVSNTKGDEIFDQSDIQALSLIDKAVEGHENDHLSHFSSLHGSIRDGRGITSRVRGLLLTADNVQTFIDAHRSTRRKGPPIQIIKMFLDTLKEQCIALDTPSVLNVTEKTWTGKSRRLFSPREERKTFVQFKVSYYIETTWSAVRELTYLAMTDQARDVLLESVRGEATVETEVLNPVLFRAQEVYRILHGFLRWSIRRDLSNALSCRTYCIYAARVPVYLVDHAGFQRSKRELVLKADSHIKTASPGKNLYNLLDKVDTVLCDRKEDFPFQRSSARFDSEKRHLRTNWKEAEDMKEEIVDDKLLVYGRAQNVDQVHGGNLCLFILAGETQHLLGTTIGKSIREIYELGKIYATSLNDRKYRREGDKEREGIKDKLSFTIPELFDHFKLPALELKEQINDWIQCLESMMEWVPTMERPLV